MIKSYLLIIEVPRLPFTVLIMAAFLGPSLQSRRPLLDALPNGMQACLLEQWWKLNPRSPFETSTHERELDREGREKMDLAGLIFGPENNHIYTKIRNCFLPPLTAGRSQPLRAAVNKCTAQIAPSNMSAIDCGSHSSSAVRSQLY